MNISKSDHIKCLLSLNNSLTTDEIAKTVGCTRQMVNYVKRQKRDRPQELLDQCPEYKEIPAGTVEEEPVLEDSVVGFFTDTHEPACHPRFFEFVRDTFKAHGVTEVVCGGDLIDHHFISRHTSEPDGLSPVAELELAIENLKKWTKEFPNVKVCKGNHDAIPSRQAKELGIPKQYLRDLNEVYELPNGWVWADSWEVDGVLYDHGMGNTGMYGYRGGALANGMSYVCGHTHSNGGVAYIASPHKLIFGANGGCGMDTESYAARYGKNYKFKPTLGCVIVKNGKEAAFIPMDMDKYRR